MLKGAVKLAVAVGLAAGVVAVNAANAKGESKAVSDFVKHKDYCGVLLGVDGHVNDGADYRYGRALNLALDSYTDKGASVADALKALNDRCLAASAAKPAKGQ